jgi:regulator of nucleoside diphosphate kinase
MQPHAPTGKVSAMEILVHTERTLTELDHARLARLQRDAVHDAAVELEALLSGADLVDARKVSPDIVTMYSQVLIADPRDGKRTTLTLVYPSDAEPASGFVSVLSPVGTSLLGLRVGEIARWQSPLGEPMQAEVVALLFQPEASGDYTI